MEEKMTIEDLESYAEDTVIAFGCSGPVGRKMGITTISWCAIKTKTGWQIKYLKGFTNNTEVTSSGKVLDRLNLVYALLPATKEALFHYTAKQ